MPAAQPAAMLTYGIQVVLCGPSRFGIQNTWRQVQILDWKRYSIISEEVIRERPRMRQTLQHRIHE